MKKVLRVVAVAVLSLSILGGCAKAPAPVTKPATTETKPAATETKTDAVTTASVVNDNAGFLKGLTKDGGKYCLAILKDLKFDKELVVDGDIKSGKKDANGVELYQRKIALYTQDDKKVVTARFTLTAPKITFNSSFGSLEHGTFKGDVYVAGKNFKLVDNKVEGNIYFLNEEAKSTFKMDDKSSVTGKQELKK